MEPSPIEAPHVYLAGPDVFFTDAAAVGRTKVEICRAHGLIGLFPLDAVEDTNVSDLDDRSQAAALFDRCVTMMDRADALVANLTPFRGPSADVGTAFELGYAVGRNKPVFGYTSEAQPYPQRVTPDGHHVEPYGLTDNLMLDRAVARHGLEVVHRRSTTGDPLAALSAFEACIAQIATSLLHPPR